MSNLFFRYRPLMSNYRDLLSKKQYLVVFLLYSLLTLNIFLSILCWRLLKKIPPKPYTQSTIYLFVCLFIYLFIYLFSFLSFLGLHQQHMEVPRLGVQLPGSHLPTPQPQQRGIRNPLSKGRGRTRNLRVPSQIR